ncbi:MAG TPA: hypothetical protein VNZ44_20180 [Pyrinomonadaceae bacterium]|nr:hypothetical protein [Pyrinomonadaceae bacterium]
MNSVISYTLEMFVRVAAFVTERAASFPEGSFGDELVTELKLIVKTLNDTIAAQNSAISSEQRATAARDLARKALRGTLRALVHTARAMSVDAPGAEEKFRLPRSSSDNALLQTARAAAIDAVEYKDRFVQHGMSSGFIEELKRQIADLERAVEGQNAARAAHVSATAAVELNVERGMEVVRSLDALVRNKFRDEPATLAAWESARHVESPARTRRRTNNAAAPNGGDAPQP